MSWWLSGTIFLLDVCDNFQTEYCHVCIFSQFLMKSCYWSPSILVWCFNKYLTNDEWTCANCILLIFLIDILFLAAALPFRKYCEMFSTFFFNLMQLYQLSRPNTLNKSTLVKTACTRKLQSPEKYILLSLLHICLFILFFFLVISLQLSNIPW